MTEKPAKPSRQEQSDRSGVSGSKKPNSQRLSPDSGKDETLDPQARTPLPEDQNTKETRDEKEERHRNLAEWITFIVSLSLILWIAGYLLFLAVTETDDYLQVQMTPQFDHVERRGNLYILPLEIENRSAQGIQELKVKLTHQQDGNEETREITLLYLGERSTRTIYVFFEEDPRKLQVRVQPELYQLR